MPPGLDLVKTGFNLGLEQIAVAIHEVERGTQIKMETRLLSCFSECLGIYLSANRSCSQDHHTYDEGKKNITTLLHRLSFFLLP